mmetsp:Transcript_10180/g.29061  ORF Transcript_10180/g.29061 Transcript_10180/m.29061 type:complete len:560 (-) Transcript_10180:287-1966(-)
MEEPAHRGVGARAHVGKADGVHCAVPDDGVPVPGKSLDEGVRALLAAVRGQRHGQGQGADDLLVLGVVGVGQELGESRANPPVVGTGAAASAQEQEADTVRRGFAPDRRVIEQNVLELVENTRVRCAHGREPQGNARAVLEVLVRPRRVEGIQDEGHHGVLCRGGLAVPSLGGVDDAQGEQCTALGRRRRGPGRRQILLENVLGLLQGALGTVDHAEGGRRRELGPVRRSAKPIHVLGDKGLARAAGVHETVRRHRGLVQGRVPGVHGVLERREEQRVRLGLAVEEIHLHVHREPRSPKHAQKLGHLGRRRRRGTGRRGWVRGSSGAFRRGRVGGGGVAFRWGRARLQVPQEPEDEGLVLALCNVKGDLVRQKLGSLWALQQPLQGLGRGLGVRHVLEAENLRSIVPVLRREGSMHLGQATEDPQAEVPGPHDLVAPNTRLQSVGQERPLLRPSSSPVQNLPDLVHEPRLQGDAHGVGPGPVSKAPVEDPLHNPHHAGVDLHLFALRLTPSEGRVLINALGHQRVDELVLRSRAGGGRRRHVKVPPSTQRQPQRIIVLL